MKDSLKMLCERFIAARDTVKTVFKMENSYIYPVSANVFISRGQEADAERLLACKRVINDQAGIFSNFRGTVRTPLACMLSLSDRPEEKMAQAMTFYDMLKQSFWGSEYLTLVAVLLTELTDGLDAEVRMERGKEIYRRMRKEHPFLTSSEDSVFAVLLAFSLKDNDALIEDMEASYRLLKERFSDSNCVQTASHVLALTDGAPQEKTDRMLQIYDSISAAGGKYGRHYELAVLAALSVLPADIGEMTADILDADAFLSEQKGYGFWGLDRRTRMMHAAMLTADLHAPESHMESAALASTLSIVAAQQMAMCAAICAASASSAAAASSAHSS